jgi:glucoamylase
VRRRDAENRYQIEKTILADPHLPVVLQHTRVTGDNEFLDQLKLYVQCAPHMQVGGWHNEARIEEASGLRFLMAHKGGRWMAMAASCPFSSMSVGYVGASDGWTDLAHGFQMDWQFDYAPDGNVALTGEIDLAQHKEFTVGVAFGETRHSAITSLLNALCVPFAEQQQRFYEQWHRTAEKRLPLETRACDEGNLYRASYSVLLAHEDKTYPGALIASLAIPWGETRADADGEAGYHLVWTRDLVQSALGLVAAGNTETPFRALIYLAASQNPDGSFAQNFWIDGRPYWTGVQLDEIAFPIILARRLYREDALHDFDAKPMVLRGIRFLILQGPATQQERWEEASGYSPSTLAADIAAFLCTAAFAREHDNAPAAQFLEEYADWMRDHLEAWTVTEHGTLLPEVPRHFVRINPVGPHQSARPGALETAMVTLSSQPPDEPTDYPARDIVDAGFLELVRYGILTPDDPLVVDTLKVIDATLKAETPHGTAWRRYNHDGYGQRANGDAYVEWGQGRPWPLLTGERGHYELAAGRDPSPYIQDMERLATATGLLPEQVWDTDDIPDRFMFGGRATGSAAPLLWAHAEYIKLLRSARDGQVFDRIPEVAARYLENPRTPSTLEIWGFSYPLETMAAGKTLRVLADAPFRLRWSSDEWRTIHDTDSTHTALDISYVDVPTTQTQQGTLRFTFYWPTNDRWEDEDFVVSL